MPCRNLFFDPPEILLVFIEQERLREQNKVLMAVHLPDDFVIARSRRVQIRTQAEVIRAGLDAAQIVAPPADVRAGAEFHAEQRQPVYANLARDAQHFGGERRVA
jgi:hypothetical protein